MKSFFGRIALALVVASTAFSGASFADNTPQNTFEQIETADFDKNEATNETDTSGSADFSFGGSFEYAPLGVCRGKQNVAKEKTEKCRTVCVGLGYVWSGSGTSRNCVCCESTK